MFPQPLEPSIDEPIAPLKPFPGTVFWFRVQVWSFYGFGSEFRKEPQVGLARCRVRRNDSRITARFCLCRALPIALKSNRRAVQQQLKCNAAVEPGVCSAIP